MYAAFTELSNAETVKTYLIKHHLLNQDYLPLKELDHLYFPLLKKAKVPGAQVAQVKLIFQRKFPVRSVDELLQNQLTAKELMLLPRSQEVVGKILILEIPPELKKKEKLIAQAYLQFHRHLETVVKKSAIHTGEYRLRKVTVLAGKKTKETVHVENGIKLKLDLEKTYFSARSGSERLRIAQLVKKNEEVLVMFSGAAPYPLVIAKNSPARIVYGIEINPLAHQYALENVKLNKLEQKVIIVQGDVRTVLPTIKKKFDRIVMPLPKTGEQFLDLALKKAKPKAVIHLYDFLSEPEIPSQRKVILAIGKKAKKKLKILRVVKCGQFGPGVFRICFDLKVG